MKGYTSNSSDLIDLRAVTTLTEWTATGLYGSIFPLLPRMLGGHQCVFINQACLNRGA